MIRYIVVTCDEHIPNTMNRGAWASQPEIRGDVERSLDFIDDWCKKAQDDGNDVVRISAGDTIDSFDPEPDRLRWMISYFKRHLQNCRKYYYIQGQHERVVRCSSVPWMSVVTADEKVVYAHRSIHEIAGRPFVFHDQASQAELFGYLQQLPASLSNATLIAHQLWHPWLPASRACPSLLALPHSITQVISGDYHVRKSEWLQCTDGHTLSAWSVGPLAPQDISEDPNCRFIVIDTADWTVHEIPLPSRPILNFKVVSDHELDQVIDTLTNLKSHVDMTSVNVPIVRVKYSPDLDQPYRRIQAACSSRAHLFIDPLVSASAGIFTDIYAKQASQDIDSAIAASGVAPAGSTVNKIVYAALEAVSQADLTAKLDEIQKSYFEETNENRESSASTLLPAQQA